MHKKQLKKEIIIFVIAILILLFIGAFIFRWLEGWSFVNAFYFVAMTTTTVGYGDFTPTHTLSKIITIIYSLSIIPFVLYTFSAMAKYNTERLYHTVRGVERKQEKQEEELIEQKKELKGHQKKIKKTTEEVKEVSEEIAEHDKELEIVENVVEKELEKGKK